jgi:hypothetical protein
MTEKHKNFDEKDRALNELVRRHETERQAEVEKIESAHEILSDLLRAGEITENTPLSTILELVEKKQIDLLYDGAEREKEEDLK